MADPVPNADPDTTDVKEMAHFILAFIEGHPVGYLAAIHAATIVMTSMALEQPSPTVTLDVLLDEVRAEARAMIEVVSSGMVHDA